MLHVPEVPTKIPSASRSSHITYFSAVSRAFQSLLGTKPHWFCCVLLLKTADFNWAPVQCCNCAVRCKTTNNRHRKSLSNPTDKFPELQSCSYSTLGKKNKPFRRVVMPQETQVRIWFSDLNLRACFWCTLLQHTHISMMPELIIAFYWELFLANAGIQCWEPQWHCRALCWVRVRAYVGAGTPLLHTARCTSQNTSPAT